MSDPSWSRRRSPGMIYDCILVRKLFSKFLRSGESHEVPVILAEVKDDRVLVIFEESGDWKESWILSTDSIIIRDGMRVTDISSMKIGSFGVMVLDGKLSSSPLLVWFGLPVPNVRGEVGDLIRRQDGRIFVSLPVPAAARKPNLVMFHGDLGRYSQVEVGSQVCVWAWSRKVGVDGRFKEGAALVVVRT